MPKHNKEFKIAVSPNLPNLHTCMLEICQATLEQRKVKICELFLELMQVKAVSLFIKPPRQNNLSFYAATKEVEEKYKKGILSINTDIQQNCHKFQSIKNEDITLLIVDDLYEFKNQFLTIVPLQIEEVLVGVFLAEHDQALPQKTEEEEEIINTFLCQTTPFVEHFRDTFTLQEKNKSLRLLYNIGHELSYAEDEEQLLDKIIALIERFMGVDRCSLMTMDSDNKTLRIKKAFGIENINIHTIRINVGEGIAGSVASSAKPLLIKDLDKESNLKSTLNRNHFRTNSLLSIPLLIHGKVIGVVNVNNRKDGQPFTEDDLVLLTKVGSELANVLQRSYMSQQLNQAILLKFSD